MAFNINDFDLTNHSSSAMGGTIEPPTLKYNIVHLDDREPVRVIQPHLERGPWIAGGAPLLWYQGLPVNHNDIDVFCRDQLQADQLISEIKSYSRYSVKHTSKNAVTIEYYAKGDITRSWQIQIIIKKFFKNLDQVLDNFDITVCQIGTAGNEWCLKDQTAIDIREKVLRMNKPLMPNAPARLLKYWVYGYRPVDGLLDEIRQDTNIDWKSCYDNYEISLP